MPPKQDQDSKPAEKQLKLYTMLLFSGHEMSLTELAKELSCSKQTVGRMLDQLEYSKFGKLLRTMHGREAYYSLDRPKKLPQLSLDSEGLRQLALCRAFLLHLLPQSMQDNMKKALREASAYLPEDADTGIDEMESVGQAFTKGLIDYSPFQDMLREIIEAIRHRKVCVIEYRPSIHVSERRYFFAPQKLVAYREALYVRGWMVTDKGRAALRHEAPANLAVHRMVKVEVTRRGTEHLPQNTDCGDGCFGLMNGDPFHVRVRFVPSAATYVFERHWSDDQSIDLSEDGSLTLTMTARSRAEVVAWVLSFADTAEVLEPAWLRDEIAERASRIWKSYARDMETP